MITNKLAYFRKKLFTKTTFIINVLHQRYCVISDGAKHLLLVRHSNTIIVCCREISNGFRQN